MVGASARQGPRQGVAAGPGHPAIQHGGNLGREHQVGAALPIREGQDQGGTGRQEQGGAERNVPMPRQIRSAFVRYSSTRRSTQLFLFTT